MRSLLLLSAIILAASPAMAETRSGPAEVLDGDTIEIQGKRHRRA